MLEFAADHKYQATRVQRVCGHVGSCTTPAVGLLQYHRRLNGTDTATASVPQRWMLSFDKLFAMAGVA